MLWPVARLGRVLTALRDAPTTVPAFVAFALFVLWASEQAGYPITHWAPGAVLVLALLGICIAFVGLRGMRLSRPVAIAIACLAGYTALSYLSILWAGVRGEAWEGADRTLLYLLVFALMVCWPQRGGTAAALLAAWALALVGLAIFVLLHLEGDSRRALESSLLGGRLTYPSGYANSNAAQWLIAAWPALLLARSERLHWALRGLLAGGVVVLAGVALLSESRGSLYSTPVMIVLVFALLPGRVRTFCILVPVACAVALAARPILHVDNRVLHGLDATSAMAHATTVTILAAIAVGLVVCIGAALEGRLSLQDASAARARRAIGAVAALAAICVLAGGLVALGDPITKLRHGWDTFKHDESVETIGGNRLTGGLGSSRYDIYRVALDEFLAHPIAGIGADNFQQQYLAHGRSLETPRYPHSVEFRTLAETGLIGALLAIVGLAAALVAVARAIRRSDALGRAVAAAALGGFGYWVVHGSVDWFWEFAGLGAPAFALLGLACSLGTTAGVEGSPEPTASMAEPRPAHARAGVPRRLAHGRAVVWAPLAAALTIAAVVSLVLPWLSQLELENAAKIWARSPSSAYSALHDAANLNPLSDAPQLLAGSIALRLNQLDTADRYFAQALQRSPQDSYATLERGAIASEQGRSASALALLRRAHQLNPRDSITREALDTVIAGHRVDVKALNQAILARAELLS
jgi:tetratricopeptide (TPR) repeat protein